MFGKNTIAGQPPMSLYRVAVDYLTETTSWDTYSAFTIQATSENEAYKLAYQAIGEFHAPLRLFVTESTPVVLVPHIVATEPIAR